MDYGNGMSIGTRIVPRLPESPLAGPAVRVNWGYGQECWWETHYLSLERV
jgi:hypothetical protein